MTVTERVTGVLTLRPSVFEEIEADQQGQRRRLSPIVVIGTLAAGLGGGQYGGPARMLARDASERSSG